MKRYVSKLFSPHQWGIMAISVTLVAILEAALSNIAILDPVGKAWEGFQTTDLFYKALQLGEADTCQIISIVDITPLHDRDKIAAVMEELATLEPYAVGVDIVFEHPQEPASADSALIRAVNRLKETAVFGYKITDFDYEKGEFTRATHSFFVDSSFCEGCANVERDMKRNISLKSRMNGKEYQSSMMAMLRKYVDDDPYFTSLDSYPVSYMPIHFRVIPYDSLQQNRSHITGKAVLFGAAHESIDLKTTPIGQMHGVVFQAYALKSLIDRSADNVLMMEGFWYYMVVALLLFVSALLWRLYLYAVSLLPSPVLSEGLRLTIPCSFVAFFLCVAVFGVSYWLFYSCNMVLDVKELMACIVMFLNAEEIWNLIKNTIKKKQ